MNIALPEAMKLYIQEQVSAGGYSSVSEYIRELVRADQRRRHEEEVDRLLLEGLASGQPIEVSKEYWEDKRRKLAARKASTKRP
jgi:antitoxin ParD1/3/4